MKKMLVAAVAAMVAFAAGNANAQCIGCQQNAQPVFGATQAYSTPMQSYSAPVQTYSAPMQSYSAPMQSYSAPMQSYSAPMQSYTPVQNYSAPCNCGASTGTPVYTTPIQTYSTPTSGCIGCSGMVGQPIYGGTVTSGTIINGGVVEGSIVEPAMATPTAAGEATATPEAQPVMEDTTEPPVPAVSTPGPEADGT